MFAESVLGEALDRAAMIEELENKGLVAKRSDIVYRHMRDPALLRYYYKIKAMPLIDKLDIAGSSPTELFVGRHNYPYVNIGPMVPPAFGDTSILATPERWRNMTIDNIVDMRSRIVRGMYKTKVTNVENGRMEEMVRDLALADRPAEAEVAFLKKPFVKIAMRDEVQPFGPSAMVKNFELYNVRADTIVEKRYSDTDATAKTAMIELYDKGIPVSKIQKGLSAGLFGIGRNRKFVPTRWSITAVDDTLSKSNLDEVKVYSPIDAIHAYYHEALDNRWLVFLIPGNWQYESIEAFYPGTVWNENGQDISIFGSYEGYNGRKTYAEMGGCYYSGRLAITEKLQLLQKQAIALILREVHKGYIMPVGVWNVREHVRATLETKPEILHGLNELFDYTKTKMEIGANTWIQNSALLRDLLSQKRILEYVK